MVIEFQEGADRTLPLRVFTARSWQIVQGKPGRVAHAAHPGGRTTLCGVRLGGLVEYPDYVYADLRDTVRCAECDSAAAITQHGPDD